VLPLPDHPDKGVLQQNVGHAKELQNFCNGQYCRHHSEALTGVRFRTMAGTKAPVCASHPRTPDPLAGMIKTLQNALSFK
jgi:hypothetical protein